MKRSGPLRRLTGLRVRRKPRRLSGEQQASLAWRFAVLAKMPPLDVAEPGVRGYGKTVEAHHVIPQQTLRARARDLGLHPAILLWDYRVGVPVTTRRHARHHSGHEPIRRDELPADVFEFAAAYGLDWYIDRHYPERKET